MVGGRHRKHLAKVCPALTAGWLKWPDAGGFCCCRHPYCKGGLMQIAIFETSAATSPLGMLRFSGQRCWLFRSCVPRVLHRAARPRHPSVQGPDAPAHDHHRRAATLALQLGAFAQWWQRERPCRWWHALRAGRRRAEPALMRNSASRWRCLQLGWSGPKLGDPSSPLRKTCCSTNTCRQAQQRIASWTASSSMAGRTR